MRIAAAILAFAVAGHADIAAAGAEDSVAFGAGSGRAWFSGCEFQAERYVVCKNAERALLDAIGDPGSKTPGEALQASVRALFETKGCTFAAPEGSFRVNGIFLSFDSKAAEAIACAGRPSSLAFAPGRMSLSDTVYFLAEDPPSP